MVDCIFCLNWKEGAINLQIANLSRVGVGKRWHLPKIALASILYFISQVIGPP